MDKVTPGRPGPPFRVGFVPGVMPGKWERTWRERMRRPLELVTVEVAEQEQALREGRVDMCLVRGEVDRDDGRANDAAVKDGSRIFSAYVTPTGEKLWVITEADRSSTCVLTPGEY